jgi:hypothetical protein
MILGYAMGYFMRKGWHSIKAVACAYAIQLPWLIVTDIYLAAMSVQQVKMVVLSLAISNLVLVYLASKTSGKLKKWIR